MFGTTRGSPKVSKCWCTVVAFKCRKLFTDRGTAATLWALRRWETLGPVTSPELDPTLFELPERREVTTAALATRFDGLPYLPRGNLTGALMVHADVP